MRVFCTEWPNDTRVDCKIIPTPLLRTANGSETRFKKERSECRRRKLTAKCVHRIFFFVLHTCVVTRLGMRTYWSFNRYFHRFIEIGFIRFLSNRTTPWNKQKENLGFIQVQKMVRHVGKRTVLLESTDVYRL